MLRRCECRDRAPGADLFLGNILRHAVEIAPGVRVTVDVQNASRGPARRRPSRVALSLAARPTALILRALTA